MKQSLALNWEEIGGRHDGAPAGGLAVDRDNNLSLVLYNRGNYWTWAIKPGDGHPGDYLPLAGSEMVGEGKGFHSFEEAAIACENYVAWALHDNPRLFTILESLR